MIDDEEGEIGAPDSVIPASDVVLPQNLFVACASEVVSDQPDISTSDATEEEAVIEVGPAVIDDDEGEIDAPDSVADFSTSNAAEGEAIVVASPAVIDDDEGEIDAPVAVVCPSDLCPTNLIFRLAVHGRGGYHRS